MRTIHKPVTVLPHLYYRIIVAFASNVLCSFSQKYKSLDYVIVYNIFVRRQENVSLS